ncbi:MAG: DUF2007 domain-containing protein [Bacteroidota bacterium]|nr:DUF2007 domain-containing protein [Bacteroidota bacterium]
MKDLICIKVFNSRLEAEMEQNYLKVHEIDSIISSDDAGRAYSFSLSGGVKLFVRAEDAQRAVEILESYYDSPITDIE